MKLVVKQSLRVLFRVQFTRSIALALCVILVYQIEVEKQQASPIDADQIGSGRFDGNNES